MDYGYKKSLGGGGGGGRPVERQKEAAAVTHLAQSLDEAGKDTSSSTWLLPTLLSAITPLEGAAMGEDALQ